MKIFFEKTVKKGVFRHFLENFDKKMRFFGARSFRKILGSVGQKWISEKVSKGGPFGSAGGRIPPKSAPAYREMIKSGAKFSTSSIHLVVCRPKKLPNFDNY